MIPKEWEFGFGKSKWKPFDPTQNKNLSQAFCSGEKSCDVSTPRAPSTVVLFDRMVQRKKSGWEVAVRCKPSDPTENEKCITFIIQYIYFFF